MKKTVLVMAFAALFHSGAVFAETAKVTVKGMVCAFCAQGIKKKFGENPNVQSTEVNLDKKVVDLEFKKEKTLSDEEIKKLITEAGYNVVKIERKK